MIATNPLPIIAIDPGSSESAIVILDPRGTPSIEAFRFLPNHQVLASLRDPDNLRAYRPCTLAIETPRARGQLASNDLFTTCVWIGRYLGAWDEDASAVHVDRHGIKVALLGTGAGSDSNVRQALVDRFGGSAALRDREKCMACKGRGKAGRPSLICAACAGDGRVGEPGVLHGISHHGWAALAVAVFVAEQQGSMRAPALVPAGGA